MRRSNIFKAEPSRSSAVQPTRSTTTGVSHAIATDPRPQSPNLSPINSPPLPINNDSFVFEESNNTPGSPDGASRTGSKHPPAIYEIIAQFSAKPTTWMPLRQHGTHVETTKLHSGSQSLFHDSYRCILRTARRRKSGRIPPSLKPPHLCQCSVLALKVDLMTWDCTCSSYYMGCSLIYKPSGCSAEDPVDLRVLSSQCPTGGNGLLSLVPHSALLSPSISIY
jgi:hypothetical protein